MNLVIAKAVKIAGGQKELAEACGVSQPAVFKWMNGGGINPANVPRIVSATNGQIQAHEIRPDLPEIFPPPGKIF